MEHNAALVAAMDAEGLKQADLARRLDDEIRRITGRDTQLTERQVRRWVRGEAKWPQELQRLALEAVFKRSAVELGFKPRTKSVKEDSLRRRTFVNAAAGTVSAAIGASAPSRIGASDIERLRGEYLSINSDYRSRGGNQALEDRATNLLARMQSELSRSAMSERSRTMLYHLMSDVACSAATCASHAMALERARMHMHKAGMLAGLSGSSDAQFHVWTSTSTLAARRGDLVEGAAAADAALRQAISKRDPLYKSLAHMRAAANAHSRAGDLPSLERALSAAERSFDRHTAVEERAPWIAFYGRSQFEGLTGLSWLRAGKPERAESHFHRTLAAIPDNYAYSRLLYTGRLAEAQAEQGEVELAAHTGSQALEMLQGVDTKLATRPLVRVREIVALAGTKDGCVREFLERSNR
ncbi:XRE family transcriptional regulator [Streptomyces zagrosensis]|uniref:Uncharacterized protein n=1 Tax=Streptomyces zagrosensis TaxID=1042984 RepID=A0A7W9UXQ3_9ACTN|nr:XRE family transcriptional regulator [Streptomyces zagrosensis]MBB5934877.1 hypothetical protein [Streptomyces zagrosensis]